MKHEKNTPLASNNTKNDEIMQEEKLLKSNAATKYLNVHRSTLMRWYDNGTLIPIKVAENGYKYYSKKQLDIFRQEHPELCKTVAQDIKTVAQDIKTVAQDIKTVASDNQTAANLDIGVKSTSTALQTATNPQNVQQKLAHFQNLQLQNSQLDPNRPILINAQGEVCEMSEEDIRDIESQIKQYIFGQSRHDPNDKISKAFFNITDDQYVEGRIIVKEGVKKNTAVVTSITFNNMDELMPRPRFTPFDREVCFACISEQASGNQITTIDAIYRCMTGGEKKHPSPKIAEDIRRSLDRMIFCKVTFDASDTCKKFGYNSKEPMIYTGSLLPAEYLQNVTINGKKTTCIRFLRRSPIFDFAEIKNSQILSYDKKILDLPVNNNQDTLVIKCYLARRILEILKHNLKRTITFEDVINKNGFENADKFKKTRLRKFIQHCFAHWVERKILQSFIVNKRGRTPYSVSF